MPNFNTFEIVSYSYKLKNRKRLNEPDKIKVKDRNICILQLRIVTPFLFISKHKNYKLIEDYDNRNAFDVERYIGRTDNTKLKENTKVVQLQFKIKSLTYEIKIRNKDFKDQIKG